MRACIEPRQTGSLEGMRAALEAGEVYDAALLDTLHTAEHVWAEFELACRLVCPGGLILIHDPLYKGGTVEGALQRIEQAGYGVVRLWSAERGVREDDHLGLAVIENRIRSGAQAVGG
jgi:cephalosporin hydroxylase